jgi:hypothetical protein
VKAAAKTRIPARRKRTAQGARDVRRGLKDTERRGTPSDLPTPNDLPTRKRGIEVA